MLEKSRMMAALGEVALLKPAQIAAALVANDRAKYYMSLLQAARQHARTPDAPAPNLRPERQACGIDDASLDAVLAGCEAGGTGDLRLPRAPELVDRLRSEVTGLLRPIEGEPGTRLATRLAALMERVGTVRAEAITGAQIDLLTAVGDEDTVHRVVMDAHREINRLQAAIATETIEGAAAYGLEEGDRPVVRAFMKGVARTASLKFDHPGLDATATRTAGRLVIQNDLGTTDAHVLVVRVEGLQVTVSYTDVHLQRLLFLQALLRASGMRWDDTRSRADNGFADGVYHLASGRLEAADPAQLLEFVELLGSRLVFLLDWNRARKRLRQFLPKDDAIRLLRWAAEAEVGHMGWLRMGADALIQDALQFVERATRGQIGVGEPLHEMLGIAQTVEFMRFVLRTSTEAARRGEPPTYVQDAVRAELLGQVRSGQQALLDLAAEHAAWIAEVAQAVRDALLAWPLVDENPRTKVLAARAKRCESRADELVVRARELALRAERGEFHRRLVEAADDVADELEDAAFHLSLVPAGASAESLHAPLRALGELLVQGAQEYVKAIEAARVVRRAGAREDTRDFLEAVHRILQIERSTDLAEREVEVALAAASGDFRSFHFIGQTARNLEGAADALMHCALQMRDEVLDQMAASSR
ncbi:MAG TPA: DUF47 family protein [Burkholderiaceae bacterium]|nr:DUF47 family protein [Burkholderiaceae bacterium]